MKMTFSTILIGGLIVFFAVVTVAVFVPSLLWQPPDTTIGHPYTPLEERGREVFYSNGCNYCHTQYVREEDTGMGAVSQGGNYNYDNPMILGSERTGPDLSYIGRKRSEAWEIEHWKDPRSLSPLSIMPSFEFLSDEDLHAMAAYIYALGDRVAAEWMIRPPDVYTGQTDPIAYPATALPPPDTDVGWPAWTAAGLQEGKELYIDHCQTCHGCAGNGLGTYGGTLVVTPANFKQEPFRNMPDDQWFWHVSEGVQGTVMPPWKESLTEEQRWKVIRYVQDTFARPVMRDPAEGDIPPEYADLTNPLPLTLEVLDQGKAIWTRECMVCHGDAGRGNGPYGTGIQPRPPDFGDGSYGTLADPTFTDADYFWRISEGLPWSAMQVWKLQYSEDDRWALVHYIRTMFTQTEERPPAPEEDVEFLFPEVYKPLTIPAAASFERGKQVFLTTCAHCHGLAGDGTGWDGAYLDPVPADFRDDAGKPLGDTDQGEYLARVTFGNMDTAMPSWGEFLPEDQRWDVIRFVVDAFRIGRPAAASVYGSGTVAANFVTLSQDNWVGEGNVISETHGAELYTVYCSTCHGMQGLGDGTGMVGNASKAPAPLPPAMSEPYILWRIWEGVPDTIMPPFHWLLSEADIWDITVYVETLVGTK